MIHLLWKPPGSFCTPPAVGPGLWALDLDVKCWATAQCALASASLAGGEAARARAGAEPGPDDHSEHVCVLQAVAGSVQPQPLGRLVQPWPCHTHRGMKPDGVGA